MILVPSQAIKVMVTLHNLLIALAFCRQQGVEHCFLDASEADLICVKKFGFEPLSLYQLCLVQIIYNHNVICRAI